MGENPWRDTMAAYFAFSFYRASQQGSAKNSSLAHVLTDTRPKMRLSTIWRIWAQTGKIVIQFSVRTLAVPALPKPYCETLQNLSLTGSSHIG